MLYVQSGGATVTIGDAKYKLTAGSVAYFPANVKHGLVNDTGTDLVGVQIYAPPGNPTADARYFNWPTVGK
jgi:quercetin dioxygenase-like cupin family protein